MYLIFIDLGYPHVMCPSATVWTALTYVSKCRHATLLSVQYFSDNVTHASCLERSRGVLRNALYKSTIIIIIIIILPAIPAT